MKHVLFALYLILFGFFSLLFASCDRDTEYITEDFHYREAIDALDWGGDTVIVIGHRTPDVDATCSAIAYAGLMNAIGHSCVARVPGSINREMEFVGAELGIDIPAIQDSVGPGQRIILTDHSGYAQAVAGARDAQILQVIDHHGIGDIISGGQVYYKAMPFGSTCTIVYTSYRELGIDISPSMAKAMLAGIISDTRGLAKAHTSMDSLAMYSLASRLNMSRADVDTLSKRMTDAATGYYGMTDKEIYLSDYKDYEIEGVKLGVASLVWRDTETVDEFLLRMKDVSETILQEKGNTMMFALVHSYRQDPASTSADDYVPDGTYIVYCGEGAREMAESIYGPSVGAAWCYSSQNLSRKSDFIPDITSALR